MPQRKSVWISQLFLDFQGVCVEDGWCQQPHLTPVRLIRLWGWVGLHNCCILSNRYGSHLR